MSVSRVGWDLDGFLNSYLPCVRVGRTRVKPTGADKDTIRMVVFNLERLNPNHNCLVNLAFGNMRMMRQALQVAG
jgi:hypothetical protein